MSSKVQKFVKKPVIVEAIRVTEETARAAYVWVEENTEGSFDPYDPRPESGITIDPHDGMMCIATLEGLMKVNLGDWIIRGVKGEFYPCKPDIFAATYEVVEEVKA